MNTNSIRAMAAGLGLLTLAVNLRADAEPEKVYSISFSQGILRALKEGKVIQPTNDVLVASVAVVQTNGVFKVKQGKERQLTDGQTIGADGMLTSPDGSVVPIVDHIIVKNGRVMVVKDGAPTALAGEFALPDGSKVTADATQRGTDGKIRRLLDGQILKLDGSSLPVTDTASIQGGKVVLYKDGGRIELRRGQIMAMSDNSKVSGDGYVIKADGSRVNLKEGEIFKIEGVSTR
jgi:hypothetical protein